MADVHVKKNTYTVDALHQWDVNQTLTVYGLSLSRLPEIHFSNVAMDRAVVRQATMDTAGVIRAEIPNSLLQKPYTINAYICVYEGETFKTLYQIGIPITKRAKPGDYTLEDDPEVYSFNALENLAEHTLAVAEEALATAKKAVVVNDNIVSYGNGTLVTKKGEKLSPEDFGAQSADANIVKLVGGVLQTFGGAKVPGLQIRTGSYTGEGNSTKTLTFDILPQVIIVTSVKEDTGATTNQVLMLRPSINSIVFSHEGGSAAHKLSYTIPTTWGADDVPEDNTYHVGWSENSQRTVLDSTGVTYQYIVLGIGGGAND